MRIPRSLAPIYDDFRDIYPQADAKVAEHNKLVSKIDDEMRKFSNPKKIIVYVKELAKSSEAFKSDLEHIRGNMRKEHNIPMGSFRKHKKD